MNLFNNTCVMNGEITNESTGSLIKFLGTYGDKSFNLFINSAGGEDVEGFAMYDLLRLHKNYLEQVTASGQIESSAILPFLAGDYRVCTAHTVFMFHNGTTNIENIDAKELDNYIKESKYLNMCYELVISERTNLTVAQVKQKIKHGHYFNAQEALDMGFVHKIL
jgi:ATP-dependent protease ClpP protease subunit